jgi:transposase
MGRKHFSPEFKLEAASKVVDEGLTITQACTALDVGPTAMRRWIMQLREERAGGTVPGCRPITPEQRRIRELEAQVRQLEEDKTILKKATAFFIADQNAGKRRYTR